MPPDSGLPPHDSSDETRFHRPTQLDDTQPTQPIIPSGVKSGLVRWLLVGIAILVIMVVAGGIVLLALPGEDVETATITLHIGGETSSVNTRAETIAGFLEEQGINFQMGDIISPGLTTEIEPGMTIQLDRARPVTLTIDGQTSTLRTTSENPQEILHNAGVTLDPADKIYIDGTEAEIANLTMWPVPVTDITIRRAVPVRIIDGDDTRTIQTTGDTVGDALFDAGITLFLADTVAPDLSTPVTPDMEITVDRSRPLSIVVDGTRIETRANGPTVGDALAEAGVALAGLDYTIPSESSELVAGMSVRVIRVTEEIATEQETISFETIFQADPELPLDERRVIQQGQNGLIQRTVRVRSENGVEISRTVETEEQVSQPVNHIVAYGTNIIIRTLNTPEGPLEYWRRLRVYATSYHPAALGGDNITATGRTLVKGIVGIDPDIIPYDTRLYVEGYGTGIAADTGAPRSNPYWIDLGYEDHNWVNWHEWVDVYLLTPVPATVNYLLPQTQQGGPLP